MYMRMLLDCDACWLPHVAHSTNPGLAYKTAYSRTCLERPLPWENVLYFQYNWTCHQRPPVFKDHFFMANGVVFQDRFHCILIIISRITFTLVLLLKPDRWDFIQIGWKPNCMCLLLRNHDRGHHARSGKPSFSLTGVGASHPGDCKYPLWGYKLFSATLSAFQWIIHSEDKTRFSQHFAKLYNIWTFFRES